MSDTGILGKKKFRVEPTTFPITSSDALPLSYGRLVGAKAIKLGSCDKHPAYCKDLNVEVWQMHNERKNVMVYVKPGEYNCHSMHN